MSYEQLEYEYSFFENSINDYNINFDRNLNFRKKKKKINQSVNLKPEETIKITVKKDKKIINKSITSKPVEIIAIIKNNDEIKNEKSVNAKPEEKKKSIK
ncbi:hypothetical protein GVAV_000829 [Gurleya vavrai]